MSLCKQWDFSESQFPQLQKERFKKKNHSFNKYISVLSGQRRGKMQT